MRRAPTTPPANESGNLSDNAGPDTFRYYVVFDGGSLGNPGKGYGSYQIRLGDVIVRHQREDYGNAVTNNQAEYLTLIRALQWLVENTGDAAGKTRILVNGDSQLVLNQLMGRWKVRNEGLRVLYDQAARLMTKFKDVELVWHPRAKSVEHLGH